MQKINSTNIIQRIVTPTLTMGIASYDAFKNYRESDKSSKLNSIIQDTVTISTLAGSLYLSNKGLNFIKTSGFYKKLKLPEIVKNYLEGIAVSVISVTPGCLVKDFLNNHIPVKKKVAEDKATEYLNSLDNSINNIKKAYGYSGMPLGDFDVPMRAVYTTEMINGETGSDKIKNFAKAILIGPIIPTIVGLGAITPFTKFLKEKELSSNKFILVLGSIFVGLGAEAIIHKIVDKLTPSDKTRENFLNEITKRQKELIKLDFVSNSFSSLKKVEINLIMKNLNELKNQADQLFPIKYK